MLKKIMFLTIITSTLVLLALVPMSVSAISDEMPKIQTTVEATLAIPTLPVGETPASSAPATGIPMSTLIIFALIGLVALAVIIGGAALLNRRQ